MGALKSGFVAIAVAGLFGTMAVVGCSADGSAGGISSETSPTDPAGDGAQLPEPSLGADTPDDTDPGGSSSGGTDDKDAGPTDPPEPPAPKPGDPCSKPNEIFAKTCGMCGKQEAVCLASGEGGAGTWSEYGACTGETGECVPGTVETLACGNCGTQTRTCSKYCGWSVSACAGQPKDSCEPGTVKYSTAGCPEASTYRKQTCQDTCVWGGLSATCAAPENANKMTAKATVGGVTSKKWTLSPSHVGKKVYTCGTSITSADNYQYVAVEISNPTSQTASVSVYQSKASGGEELDTVLWIYKDALPPMNDTELKACDYGAEDSCDADGAPCGNVSSYHFAGLSDILIPPNGKILVYSAGYLSTVTGDFMLNVRTDSFM